MRVRSVLSCLPLHNGWTSGTETVIVEPREHNHILGESPRGVPGEGTMTVIACVIIIVVFTILALCF